MEANVGKPFEMGAVKIIEGKESTMSKAEKQAMECFKLKNRVVEERNDVMEEVNKNLMLADIEQAKRRRMNEASLAAAASQYMNLEWISTTTNHCGRLFSKCKTSLQNKDRI